jgi:leucyl-tRNA synthetase
MPDTISTSESATSEEATADDATQDYGHAAIEERWQTAWREAELDLTPASPDTRERSAYIFTAYPLPAADGTPLGTVRSFCIGDACTRFMRARGSSVLFAPVFDAFGLAIDMAAARHDTTPAELVENRVQRADEQFRRLGFSFDFSRSSRTSDPEMYRSSQRLFLMLLERNLVHRAEHGWCLRFGSYLQENEQRLGELEGWSDAVLASQRAILVGIDGVELEVASLDGASLTVFTPHAEAFKRAEFVAISPNHPDIEQWISTSELQTGGMTETGRLVSGAGTGSPLAVIVSATVDARFGPTAVLGIPAVDETDAKLAQQMKPSPATSWQVKDKGSPSLRPAQRYSERDVLISHPCGWGAPIPVVHCETCGTVPVAIEDLPVQLPEKLNLEVTGNPLEQSEEFLACACPRCSAPARRESETLQPHFDGLWQWLAPCLAPEARAESPFENSELERWLGAARLIREVDPDGLLFDQRVTAKALRDIGPLAFLTDGEPFAGVTIHGPVLMPDSHNEDISDLDKPDLDKLIGEVGADALRLAILHGAAPANALTWTDHTLRFCQRWLSGLWEYATPRLQALAELGEANDEQAPRAGRGRLAKWSRIATERITENLADERPHRATGNAMTFLARIKDFERQAIERHGALSASDSRALANALLLFAQLLAPLAPHISQELWASAGREGFVARAPWPEVEARD